MDAPALSVLEKLKIDAGLTSLVRQRMAMQPTMPLYAFHVARVASQIVELLRKRGIDLNGKARELKAFASDGAADMPAQPRKVTANLYEFDQSRTHGQRKKDNAAAMALLRAIDAGELAAADLDDDQKATLAKYSGTGGNLVGADGLQGSAYEYYTPKPIAEGMWSMLAELGFKGGKVLDPCAGVGIFGATAPASAAIEAVELNETSGRINQLVNGGAGYNAVVSPFEAVASRTDDEIYDAVVSNVPFGGVHDRGSNRKIDPKYQDQPLETYFILRSLEKLRPGGLAAFIVPPRVVSAKGGREEQLRMAASYMAEFMGAYRLPNSVFGSADADTITDVIVLRKFGRDAARKVEELREQNPAALIAANVLWPEFIDGKYFQGEGRRFVLGEFVAKDPSKFRDVDRVVSDQSVSNIGKLLRKFPGSRIDWAALEATETAPIEYNEGDTMTMAGRTLEMRDGAWVSLGESTEESRYDNLGPVLSSALAAVSNKVNHEDAVRYAEYLGRRSLDLDMPVWLRAALRDLNRVDATERARLWTALTAGLATIDVMQAHSGERAFNYFEEYPVLSDVLVATAASVVKAPAAWSRESKAAFNKARIVYSRKTGFEAVWKGEGAADVDVGSLDQQAQVNALVYTHGTTISVEHLSSVLGESFDVMGEDDWCLDSTGTKATKADDYYTGNYAEFLARIDGEIQAAEGAVREKLLRQRAAAEGRLDKMDPTALRYNLFSPFVTIEEKAEFMRRFMHPAFAVGVNNLGQPYIVYEGPSGNSATTEQKLMSRMASYLSGNAAGKGVRSLTLQGKELAMSDRDALAMLRKYAQRLNTQFDGWVKASPTIMDRMARTANDPDKLYFSEVDDNTPVEIPGMNPELELHGYQNAFVRQKARNFSGINGFDVGLGKTFTSLAATQYVQSIGVKKKTAFVVPNSVLSNWRREAARAYLRMDDCLFIGLEVNERTGKASVNSSNYARDFMRVLENRHRKVFCTMEAFSMLPLKDETIAAYEAYLTSVDPSFEPSEKKADTERAASKIADVTGSTGAKSSAYPFFEDLGIDSLVLDEAHAFKNSKDTLEFSGGKFLSVAEASQRGRDMQMKAWFVRGLTAGGDGVMPLTATPITNSPLEIYSMLTLAVGEKKVHDLCMGVRGADAFMDAMCMIEDDEDVGIDGTVKSYRIFTGLQNVNLLRNAISSTATIKTGKDVKAAGDDLRLPDAPEMKTAVILSADTKGRLNEYKMAYRAAKELTGMARKDAEPVTPEEIAAFERVQARFGEEPELIAHPFNLIQKMTALIADPELDERATFYSILGSDRALAEGVIAAFNKLGKTEQRARGGPWTDADAVVGKVVVKDGGGESVLLRIKVRATFTPDGRIVIDTTDYNVQAEFEKLATKAKLDLDCSIPPKLAALLTNVRAEEASPRSSSGRVKQLVFCDILPMHNKIKRVLHKHAGIALAAIEVISGQSIKNPEQMQDIQDGFNAEGEDNRLRTIVANEKAEVGINLQKGTQAIHHFTIGWTPDSQHQRNGRGVRQGNTVARVNVYHYDADGTFDEYKRTLTTKKADWIGAVMDKQGGNEVNVSGGLTADQYDELIESMGDATAVQAIQDRAALKERLQRAESARQRQVINLQTAQSQQKFVKDFPTVQTWISAKAIEAYDLNAKIAEMRDRPTTKMKAETLVRFESRIAEMDATLTGMLRDLDDVAVHWGSQGTISEWVRNGKGRSAWTKEKNYREDVGRYAARVTVKEGAAIVDDWASQVQQAKAMADEALKDFVRIGQQGGGAHDPKVADAFREGGSGLLLDNQPVVAGMFVRDRKGNLAIIEGSSDNYGGVQAIRYPHISAGVADVLRGGGKLIGFESPDYDAAVTEAAEIDDAQTQVDVASVYRLFSSINPAVAARRKVETLVRYRGDEYLLPAPQFAYPVNPADLAQASQVVRDIVTAQASVIKDWDSYYFVAPSTAGMEEAAPKDRGQERRASALASRARALGVRVTPDDLSIVMRGESGNGKMCLYYAKHEFHAPAGAAARFATLTTRDEVDAAARALIAETMDWLLPDSVWLLGDVMPAGAYEVTGAYNGALRRIAEAARLAEIKAAAAAGNGNTPQFAAYGKAIAEGRFMPGMITQIEADERLADGEAEKLGAMAAKFDAEAQAAKAEKVVAAGDIVVSAGGKIGLAGQTMARVRIGSETKAVKDFIKLAAEEAGARAKWRGDALQWDVTPEAWDVLCTKYPEAAKLVTVCPAIE